MYRDLTKQGLSSSLLSKVPEVTLLFWIVKLLTTGMGEVFSDYLVKHIDPIIAVAAAGVCLAAVFILQFSKDRYVPWIYWLVVVMVSIFGTMAADIVHVVLGISYVISAIFFALVLAGLLYTWHRSEKTLSIHSIYTKKREFYYWAVVLATFALGTAAGDLTANAFNLGYFWSGVLFAVLLAISAAGYKAKLFGEIGAFWFAYIMTRPVGASFSDWVSSPHDKGGLGAGEGPVSIVMTIVIAVLVGYLTMTSQDMRRETVSVWGEKEEDITRQKSNG
ncbi:hypothetical protein LRR81_12700 [Metabacillus sp. GX 13764]|uniref:COG4705 family protein n=1 Tax=Metabacillus kandeliae TaxID=2900151 RepID=UPI001E4A8C3C|nr:hypothetical protein [Metabacillus kandeliae]MCD7035099.1 hypothetical protein [Metabacillus kandeliae]